MNNVGLRYVKSKAKVESLGIFGIGPSELEEQFQLVWIHAM